MKHHRIIGREVWLKARQEHLIKGKGFTRLRDELSQHRRDLPWVRVDQHYLFEGPEGQETLSDLFEDRSQLIVYHFMFAPTWQEGCKSCSFWARIRQASLGAITTSREGRADQGVPHST